MSDIGDKWIELWNTIYNLVVGMTDKFDKVEQGLKFPPNEFPSAFVGAGTMEYVTGDTGGTYYEWIIPIYVFEKDSGGDITAGMMTAIGLAGEIQAVLVADRELGLDWILPLESVLLDSYPRDAPPGYERQCCRVLVTVHAWLDSM